MTNEQTAFPGSAIQVKLMSYKRTAILLFCENFQVRGGVRAGIGSLNVALGKQDVADFLSRTQQQPHRPQPQETLWMQA